MKFTLKLFVLLLVGLIVGCTDSTTAPEPIPATPDPLLLIGREDGALGALGWINLNNASTQPNAIALKGNPSEIIRRENRLYILSRSSDHLWIYEMSATNNLSFKDSMQLGNNKYFPDRGVFAENGFLYISLPDDEIVMSVDVGNKVRKALIPVGLNPTALLAYGSKLYVCNSGEKTVAVINLNDNSVVKNIIVDQAPMSLARDANNRIHVVCRGDEANVKGKVFVVNPETDEIASIVYVGGTPEQIAIGADSIAYLTIKTPTTGNDGELYRYHSLNGTILNGSPDSNPIILTGASEPKRIVIRSNKDVYVSCRSGGKVLKLNGASVVTEKSFSLPGALSLYE